MTTSAAPPVRGRVTDRFDLAAGYSNTDLTAVSGKPIFAPQLIEATNANAAAQSIVCTSEEGEAMTLVVGPGATRRIEGPISSLTAAGTGANISVLALWWNTNGATRNA